MAEEQQYRERGEKQEKEEEKEEKSWEEKWRRDPLSAAAWAIILIWAGVVLLLHNFNLLTFIPILEVNLWSLFFLGAGAILLLEIILRLFLPAYRQPVLGNFVLAVVFLAIGFGGIFRLSWQCIGPAAIIVLGVWLLYTGLFRRRQ